VDLGEMTRLLDLAHSRARRLVSSGAPVYLAVNPIEYHGPHLSLHNDALITAGLVRDVHELLVREHGDWPLLVAGDLDVGVDPVPGPGSRPVPFETVCRLVVDACRALVGLGAQRVVLATFHGHPLHNVAIGKGAEWLERRGVQVVAPFNLLLRAAVRGEVEAISGAYATVTDPTLRDAMLREAARDLHAGFGETSLSLHYAPDSVGDHASLTPCPDVTPDPALGRAARGFRLAGRVDLALELELLAFGKAWFELDPFPGYTGHPHLANAEAGAVLARVLSERFAAVVSDVIAGRARSPRPLFGWMERMTLGGRISTVGR
jgi:creatinine amidohydrolase